jgi:hypothetical protein
VRGPVAERVNAAEIARRHADAGAGHELVSYREVALPLFRVDCTILVLEQKAVPPIQEYVLRAVAEGLSDVPSIAGILGIDQDVVRPAAAELLRGDNLLVAAGADGAAHALTLTEKGRAAAKSSWVAAAA